MEIKYNKYFESKISDYFKAYAEGISFGVYNESEYDADDDVIIIIRQLTGTIQNNTIRMPYQVLISVDQRYKDVIKDLFDRFAFDQNEAVDDVDCQILDETTNKIVTSSIKVKQFYNTTAIVNNFNTDGDIDRCDLTMEVTLISYDNPLDVESVKLTYKSQPININFIGLAFAYITSPESTGGIGSDSKLKNYIKNHTIKYTLNCFISSAMKQLVIDALKNELGSNSVRFDLVLNDDQHTNITYPKMLVSEATITKDYNGMAVLTIGLVEG